MVKIRTWWRKLLGNKTSKTFENRQNLSFSDKETNNSKDLEYDADEDNGEVFKERNVENPLDVSEIDGNNVTVALNKVRESRTISNGVNVFGHEHSRSNSLELFVPILESRHASLDKSELRRRAVARTTMTRVPLETTPLKNRENIDTDSDNEEEERYQTDPVEAQ